MRQTDLTFFSAQLSTGGVGRMRTQLATYLAKRGMRIDLLLGNSESPYMGMLGEGIEVTTLGTTHAVGCLPRLMAYLRKNKPRAVVADRIRLTMAAVRARALSRVDTEILTSVHLPVSLMLAQKTPSKRLSERNKIARCLPLNKAIIAISQGVANDFIDTFDVAEDRVHVVYNPVVTEDIDSQARETVDHPWYRHRRSPIIVGMGRFQPQKDFPTLIRAFAKLRQQRPCRLVILGRGSGRSEIERLAAELNIAEEMSLPGFVENPYKYLAHADLFVQSSAWEGFGNALVEAMAVGLPVISTDCRYGPREILQNGRLGPLVPVGDVEALSQAMFRMLEKPTDKKALINGAARFSVHECADGYLTAAGLMNDNWQAG